MTIEYDQVGKTSEHHQQSDLLPGIELPPLTPEAARRLAAILAPHLVAMRAVTAGTRYAESGDKVADHILTRSAPPVSPATRIFIAGMLQRLSA